MSTPEQSSTVSAEESRQGAETHGQRGWSGVEAVVWTERMVSALESGVVVSKTRLRHEGGKWYSLIDKVAAPATLAVAWRKVPGIGRPRTRRPLRDPSAPSHPRADRHPQDTQACPLMRPLMHPPIATRPRSRYGKPVPWNGNVNFAGHAELSR